MYVVKALYFLTRMRSHLHHLDILSLDGYPLHQVNVGANTVSLCLADCGT